jgi:uncharacterized protein YkwD
MVPLQALGGRRSARSGTIRVRLVWLVLALVLLSTPLAHASQGRAGAARHRASAHLQPLHASAGLTAASSQHSNEMVADGYFAHASAGGSPFWQRVQQFYSSAGESTWSVGENFLWSPGTLSPARVVGLWMESPEHRANILDPTWREIGISSLAASAAPGVFDDLDVLVVTADFGVRS